MWVIIITTILIFTTTTTNNNKDIALQQGLWSEGKEKDFTKTFSDGEYAHKVL